MFGDRGEAEDLVIVSRREHRIEFG